MQAVNDGCMTKKDNERSNKGEMIQTQSMTIPIQSVSQSSQRHTRMNIEIRR